MTKNIKLVGLDVHAATVTIAVVETSGEVRSLGTVAHEVSAIRRVLGKLGKSEGRSGEAATIQPCHSAARVQSLSKGVQQRSAA